MTYDYHHVALGGTFDHVHAGHARILDLAFHIGKKVTIGLTTDVFIREKNLAVAIEKFNTRKAGLLTYLRENHLSERAEIISLNDIYGTAAEDTTFDAIVATRETLPNAVTINKERKKRGLAALTIVTVPFLKGTDNKIIRSTRIRKGLINRNGTSYVQLLSKQKQLNLPPYLRKLLRKPLGAIVEGTERTIPVTAARAVKQIHQDNPVMVITVGDIVTSSLRSAGLVADVAVIDLRSRRRKLTATTTSDGIRVPNPAGTIRHEAVKALHAAITTVLTVHKKQVLIIKGEEDLLALPAILLAPLNAMVLYGQSDLGIILIPITEKIKEQVAGIVTQFE